MFELLPENAGDYPVWERLVIQYRVIGKPAHDARLTAAMKVMALRPFSPSTELAFHVMPELKLCILPTPPREVPSLCPIRSHHQNWATPFGAKRSSVPFLPPDPRQVTNVAWRRGIEVAIGSAGQAMLPIRRELDQTLPDSKSGYRLVTTAVPCGSSR